MQVTKFLCGGLISLSVALVLACGSQEPATIQPAPASSPEPLGSSPPAELAGDGVSLDEALSDVAAYYLENLPANAAIALISFESDA
ncbi:MAG: hypothetical protein LBB48_01315, partial [Treponema sp.]|nr:hypothetical protein [Treponema sp.]